MNERIRNKAFISAVNQHLEAQGGKSFTLKDVETIYKGIVQTLFHIVSRGDTVTLSGFGSFYVQKHKGHPVQFGGVDKIDDYHTLKFSASVTANRDIRKRIARDGRSVTKDW